MLDDAVAGFSAGVVGTALGYPLDTIKVHLQSVAMNRGVQPGMMQSVIAIYARHGVPGFYTGVAAPLCALTVLNTVNFTSFAVFASQLGLPERTSSGHRTFDTRVIVAGALVGPVASVLSTPFDLLKVQMQLHGHSSTVAALQSILRSAGPRGLYTGHRVNVLREAAFGAAYFGVYEFVRDRTPLLPVAVAVPVAGGLGGVVGWILSLPFDTVKSVVQAAPVGKQLALSDTVVASRIYAAQGWTGFFRGAVPSVIRAFLVSGTRFSAYEMTLAALHSRPSRRNTRGTASL